MRARFALSALAAATLACGAAVADETADTPADSAHAHAFTSIDGEALPLEAHAGEVLLVVNTASRCGFTPQYDGLQTLWETYGDQGLTVLGVPSDDFNQELATEAEVKEFCDVHFGITFPMTDITPVSGADSHPFYDWVRGALDDEAFPSWNFNKVLIGRDGAVIAGFGSVEAPDSPTVVRAIEAALAAEV